MRATSQVLTTSGIELGRNESHLKGTDPEVYYYTSGTLYGLHGMIGTVNGMVNGLHGTIGTVNSLHRTIGTVNRTLNGLHGTVRTENGTLNGLHGTIRTENCLNALVSISFRKISLFIIFIITIRARN
jgi:hypothetical protein